MPVLRWIIAFLIAGGTPSLSAQSVPHTFSPGSIIRANELNENFKSLVSSGGTAGIPTIRWGGVRLGRVLGIGDDGLYGMTSNGFLFLITDDDQPTSRPQLGDSFPWLSGIYYDRADCQGTPYVISGDSPAPIRLSIAFLVELNDGYYMKRTNTASTTATTVKWTTKSGTCSMHSDPTSTRYVALERNDPTVSGLTLPLAVHSTDLPTIVLE
jgi:hypothetical protein